MMLAQVSQPFRETGFAGNLSAFPMPTVHALVSHAGDRFAGYALFHDHAFFHTRNTDANGTGFRMHLRDAFVHGTVPRPSFRNTFGPVSRVGFFSALDVRCGAGVASRRRTIPSPSGKSGQGR